MTKPELIKAVAAEAGISQRVAKQAVESFLSVVSVQLSAGDTVRINNFGTFTPKHKNARVGRNPRTGEEFPIAERTVVKFKASENLLFN